MKEQAKALDEVGRGALWFSLLGGAVAWTLHLMLVYAVSEWGCAGPLARVHVLGITGTAWLLLAATVVMVSVAGRAAWVGYRSERRLRRRADRQEQPAGDEEGARRPGIFTAHSGLITSGLFVFIILVESVPTFFFLWHC